MVEKQLEKLNLNHNNKAVGYMTAGKFPRVVVADHTEFLDRHLDRPAAQGIRLCVLDEQASTPTPKVWGFPVKSHARHVLGLSLSYMLRRGKLTGCRTLWKAERNR